MPRYPRTAHGDRASLINKAVAHRRRQTALRVQRFRNRRREAEIQQQEQVGRQVLESGRVASGALPELVLQAEDQVEDVASEISAEDRQQKGVHRRIDSSSSEEDGGFTLVDLAGLRDDANVQYDKQAEDQLLQEQETIILEEQEYIALEDILDTVEYPTLGDEEVSVTSDEVVFTREVSEQSESEDAVEAIADKLASQLFLDSYHGCSTDVHNENLSKHNRKVDRQVLKYRLEHDGHYSPSEIAQDTAIPQVLKLDRFTQLEDVEQWPTSIQLKSLFEGTPPGTDKQSAGRIKRHVCLHKEETYEMEARVSYDIDSFIVFADTLAVLKPGLFYTPAPHPKQNIKTDIHIRLPRYRTAQRRATEDPEVYVADGNLPIGDGESSTRSRLEMVRDIPHIILGQVQGQGGYTVHVIFPHLECYGDKFEALTTEQHERWADQALNRAFSRVLPSNWLQHIPIKDELARNNATVPLEARVASGDSYSRTIGNSVSIPAEALGPLWADIVNTVNTDPGLHDFRDAFILVSAKNLKLATQSLSERCTVYSTLESFRAKLEDVLDFNYIQPDRLYVDVGKETCCTHSSGFSEPSKPGKEAQVYLWKRCCLESYMKWMYDGEPPAVGGAGQRYYQHSILRDTSSLTSAAPRKSKQFRGGLVYSQMYPSYKEMFDVRKIFPFDNDALEELALDPILVRGARKAAKDSRRSIAVVETAYLHSKRRVDRTLAHSTNKSYGVREEHRVRWPLFQALLTRAQAAESRERQTLSADAPSYVWPVRTGDWLSYLRWNSNKFAAGFELLRAYCYGDVLVSWEQTKTMAMFLRGLRFSLTGNLLARESALWWDERVTGDRTRYGLGFSKTLPKYGYCWLKPRVDWGRLTFRSRYAEGMLFGDCTLVDVYKRRGGHVRDFFAASRRVELAVELICRYSEVPAVQIRLIDWIVQVCLQQFRQDILDSIQKQLVEEKKAEALLGTMPFSYDYINSILTKEPTLVSGSTKFRTPHQLAAALFDFDRDLVRSSWERKPYRALYQRAYLLLRSRCGLHRQAKARLYTALFRSHWLLPYPGQQLAKSWFSIGRQTFKAADDPSAWMWMKGDWRDGEASAPPAYMSWGPDQWREWARYKEALYIREQDEEDEIERAEREAVELLQREHERWQAQQQRRKEEQEAQEERRREAEVTRKQQSRERVEKFLANAEEQQALKNYQRQRAMQARADSFIQLYAYQRHPTISRSTELQQRATTATGRGRRFVDGERDWDRVEASTRKAWSREFNKKITAVTEENIEDEEEPEFSIFSEES